MVLPLRVNFKSTMMVTACTASEAYVLYMKQPGKSCLERACHTQFHMVQSSMLDALLDLAAHMVMSHQACSQCRIALHVPTH